MASKVNSRMVEGYFVGKIGPLLQTLPACSIDNPYHSLNSFDIAVEGMKDRCRMTFCGVERKLELCAYK